MYEELIFWPARGERPKRIYRKEICTNEAKHIIKNECVYYRLEKSRSIRVDSLRNLVLKRDSKGEVIVINAYSPYYGEIEIKRNIDRIWGFTCVDSFSKE